MNYDKIYMKCLELNLHISRIKTLNNIEDVYLLIHFQKCHFRKCQNDPNNILRISENDTFESVILESVEIESVRVDRHPHSY